MSYNILHNGNKRIKGVYTGVKVDSAYQGWRPKDGTMQGYDSLNCLTKCQSFYEINKKKKKWAGDSTYQKNNTQHKMNNYCTSEIPLTEKRTTPESTAALINWGALSNILGSWRWQCASNSLNEADNLAIPVYKSRGRVSSYVRKTYPSRRVLLMSAKELQLKSSSKRS